VFSARGAFVPEENLYQDLEGNHGSRSDETGQAAG
jgi:hypothetical protein